MHSCSQKLPTAQLFKIHVIVIDENEAYSTIKLYPNPAENTLQFKLPQSQTAMFLITDITGRVLLSGVTTSESIDISSLLAGYYILVLKARDKQYRGRFVKE